MTPLHIFFVDVYSTGSYGPFGQFSGQYPYAKLEERDDYDPNLLGTCLLLSAAGKPTIAYLYISFIPGRPFEKNAIAQRFVSEVKHDIDLRAYIKHDTQSSRDLNMRKALEDLREQLDIKNTGDVIVFASHSRHFDEGGSYFEILRRYFVIEHGRSFALHLKIDKKYKDFVDLSRTTHKIKRNEPEIKTGELKFDIPTYAELKYDIPTYAELKFDIPKYGELKFDIPTYAELKYDIPKYAELKFDIPKYEKLKFDIPTYAEVVMNKRMRR